MVGQERGGSMLALNVCFACVSCMYVLQQSLCQINKPVGNEVALCSATFFDKVRLSFPSTPSIACSKTRQLHAAIRANVLGVRLAL